MSVTDVTPLFAPAPAPEVVADPKASSGMASFIPVAGMEPFAKKTISGERVSPESANRLGSYFAANRVVSEDVAKLSSYVVERLVPRGKNPVQDHAVSRIFDLEFNPDCDSFTGKQTLVQWAQSYGNGCAEIVRNGFNEIVELHLIHPTRITMRLKNGRPLYQVLTSDLQSGGLGETIDYEPEEIFHLRGMGDQWQGWSIAQLAAESIGQGLAHRGFGAAFFGNDMSVGTVVSLVNRVPDADRESYRASLQKAYAGAKNGHGILVLDNGATINRLNIPPNDGQFIETGTMSVEDIARWHRVHPEKIGHSGAKKGWASLEQGETSHANDALLPWATRIEKEAKRKLLRDEPRHFLTFFFQTLMRGDYATRTTGYQTLIAAGVATPNECREMEDMNLSKEPAADMLWMQGAMQPLEILKKGPPPPSARPALPATKASTESPALALLRRASERASAKIGKWYERASAKADGAMPVFERECRSFFEGLRADLVADFGPAMGDRSAMWADSMSRRIGKKALEAFAAGKTLGPVTDDVYESVLEIIP